MAVDSELQNALHRDIEEIKQRYRAHPRGLAGALESLSGALMTMALVNAMSDKYDDNNRGLNAAIYEMARLGVSLVAFTLTEEEKS
jgi:hypothetical protein